MIRVFASYTCKDKYSNNICEYYSSYNMIVILAIVYWLSKILLNSEKKYGLLVWNWLNKATMRWLGFVRLRNVCFLQYSMSSFIFSLMAFWFPKMYLMQII